MIRKLRPDENDFLRFKISGFFSDLEKISDNRSQYVNQVNFDLDIKTNYACLDKNNVDDGAHSEILNLGIFFHPKVIKIAILKSILKMLEFILK